MSVAKPENANQRILDLEEERDELLFRMRRTERLLARDGKKMTERKVRELECGRERWLERLDRLNEEIEETGKQVTYLQWRRRSGWVVA